MTRDEAAELLNKAAEALAEHFESVIIVATRSNPDDPNFTELVTRGRGNWYAQRASLTEVLKTDEAILIAQQIRKEKEDDL